MNWLDDIHVGDCRRTMRAMIADGVRVQCVGCELNPEYAAMFRTHRSQQQGLAL